MTEDRGARRWRLEQWGRRAARLLYSGRKVTARYAAAALTVGTVAPDDVQPVYRRGRRRFLLA